jgi:hypothetical protein
MFIGVPQVPVTLVCVTTVISGVPVGTQIAWLSNSSSGCPVDVTRVDPITNCAVTQGPFPAGGGGIAQPATVYGAVSNTVAIPFIVTRGLGTVGVACPACAQSTVAP